MNNIFSSIPYVFFKSNNGKKKAKTDSRYNALLLLLFKYIPLNKLDSTWDIEAFEKDLDSFVNFKSLTSVTQVIDKTFELCENYKTFYDNSSSNLIQNAYIPLHDVHLLKQLLKVLIKDFNKTILLSEEYEQDISFLVVSSYFYNQHMGKLPKTALINKDYLTYKQMYDKFRYINKANRLARDNKSNRDYTKIFLYPFLDYTEGTKEKLSIEINNPYDIDLIWGLIQAAGKSTNPFIFSNKFRQKGSIIKTNLNDFLQCFNTPQKHNNESLLSDTHKLYNQYLFERILNINFINCIHEFEPILNTKTKEDLNDLIETTVLPSEKAPFQDNFNKIFQENLLNQLQVHQNFSPLINFVCSPLLSSRLSVLSFYKKLFLAGSSKNNIVISEFNMFLENYLQYQIGCTIPIFDTTFHCLMTLLSNKATNEQNNLIDKSIKEYLKTQSQNYENKFYKIDEKNMLAPALYPFPKDVLSIKYTNLHDRIYNTLIEKTLEISEDNFLCKILNSSTAMENSLKKELATIWNNEIS